FVQIVLSFESDIFQVILPSRIIPKLFFLFLLLGVCRSIGVSNFLISHLEQLQEDCVVTPHVNQVEYHPFQRPQELVDYCRSREIVFEGYCPLAKGEALTHPSIVQLAKKYGRTPAQICIRWSIQNGIVTIPKSTRAERIQENCKEYELFGKSGKN
uniref:NADP-dependent oxidoreductase domain-containing protein n=1 Tax=Pavo cristatus TaxID=9049 RepID=A0A8C9FQ78_PAVCR